MLSSGNLINCVVEVLAIKRVVATNQNILAKTHTSTGEGLITHGTWWNCFRSTVRIDRTVQNLANLLVLNLSNMIINKSTHWRNACVCKGELPVATLTVVVAASLLVIAVWATIFVLALLALTSPSQLVLVIVLPSCSWAIKTHIPLYNGHSFLLHILEFAF